MTVAQGVSLGAVNRPSDASGLTVETTWPKSEEGSLPPLHFMGKVLVETYHLAVPFHDLLPIREDAQSEKANLHDSPILPQCPVALREQIAAWRDL